MECTKWESIGLLYAAGELEIAAGMAYNAHLQECTHCRAELNFYRTVQTVYKEESVVPATIDTAIERAIAVPMRMSGMFFFLAPAARKVFLATMLFALGLGGGTYIVLNFGTASHQSVAKTVTTDVPAVTASAPIDSADTQTDSTLLHRKPRGSATDIIPVGLESSK